MNRIRTHIKTKRPPRVTPRTPGAADITLGARMREALAEAGLSQQRLGAIIGVRYQQIGKYVRGEDRIAAIRLHAVAAATGKPLAWFFEGAE